jgi:SNF2 family DNA or RNA helicase
LAKIVAPVRGLKQLKEGEKAIVFSEWEDMLKLLSHALDLNGIGGLDLLALLVQQHLLAISLY